MLLGNGQHSQLNDSMQYTVDILIKALLKQNEFIRGLMKETVTNFIVAPCLGHLKYNKLSQRRTSESQ